MNAGDAVRLIELYARGADPKLTGNHELVRQLLNEKLKDFAQKTGSWESSATISSVSGQQEYELPADKVHVSYVEYDSYEAHKITFQDSKSLKEQSS